jgi:hypothetical protein
MNSGYFPMVVNPKLRRQTISDELQTPFFFGGSQIPNAMSIRRGQFSGSGMGKRDIPLKAGHTIYHQDGRLVQMFNREPFKKKGVY